MRVSLITVGLHTNVRSITHLLLPSTVTRKLLIIQASYYRITKLRAHITQKCKRLNIRKCGIVSAFCRLGHMYVYIYVYIYMCVCVCVCIYMYVCMYVCIYICVYIYSTAHVEVYSLMCTLVHASVNL